MATANAGVSAVCSTPSQDPMTTTRSFTVGKFIVTPIAQAMHNGEWLSKASIAEVDRDPVEDDIHTFDMPSLSETAALTHAELEGRKKAIAMAAKG